MERWAGFFNREKKKFLDEYLVYVRRIKNTLRYTVTHRDVEEEVPCQYKSDLQPPRAVCENHAGCISWDLA